MRVLFDAEHVTCDQCKAIVRTGMGLKITFPYATLQGSRAPKPLDFCRWRCVEEYARKQAT